MTTCGAKTRAGGKCQRPAGWGTDHVGQGRCKLHGGRAGRPIEHGRYSVKHRAELQEKIARFYNDPAAGDLRSELALLRAILQEYLEKWVDNEDPAVAATMTGNVFGMVESIGRLVERIAKILATTALTQAELQLLQATLIDAIAEFIPEPERQRAFISRIAGALGGSTRATLGTLSARPDNAPLTR